MNTFNFSRFIQFFSNEWKMNVKQYGLLWGALALTAVVFCILNRENAFGIELDAWMFWSVVPLFVVAQGFNISIQLEAFSSKRKKMAQLLQPVSQAEFLTTKMIGGFILFPLLYIVYIWVVAALISRYNLANYNGIAISGRTLDTFAFCDKTVWYVVRLWPCATAIYWTGAFYFGRIAAVKSMLAVVALYALLTGFSYVLLGLCFGFCSGVQMPLFSYYIRSVGVWDANHVLPNFIEATLLLGSVLWVAISVVKYREKTL